MTGGRRIALLLAALLLALPAGAIVALQLALARGIFTDRVDSALERALSRAVSHEAIAVRISLRPRITLTGARIANIDGGSRPDFARIGRLEVTLAIAPLLAGRVEIASLRLSDAEIILERDAAGRPNWTFGAGGEAGRGGIALDNVRIESSRLLIPAGPVREVTIAALDLERGGSGEPLVARGRIALDGEAFDVAARIGPEAQDALPLDVTIRGSGLRLALQGAVPRATATPGWSLALEAAASRDAVQRLAARAGRPVPPLAIERLAARLGPGEPWPSIADLELRLSPFDATAWLPGLQVARAELRAAGLDSPAMLSAQGRRGATDLGLTASLPSPRRLLDAAAQEALPVEAVLTSGRARLALSGDVAPGAAIGEAVFAARLDAPDFAALGPLFGARLPHLRDMTAEARLSGLFSRGLSLDRLTLSAAGIEHATGNLAIAFAPRLTFTGTLAARRLDLDALAGTTTAQPRAPGRAIPDIALPLATLRAFDARLALAANTLVAGGVTWREASATIALDRGRLLAEPFAATMPGGPLAGRLLLEAAADPPRMALRLDSRGRGLDLAAMRRAFGVPLGFEGQAELALDLTARGATTRALAATLTGDLGIAMLGGRFTGATALRIGPDLARALLPGGTPADGLALRCFAIRLTAEDGLARSDALLMEGGFGRIDGTLALNLRDETLAARLLADIRVMGITVRAPVAIGGTLAQPRVGVEPGAAMARVIGDTVANRLWRSSTIEHLRGVAGSAPPGGDCADALRLARLGRAGPVPEAAPAPIPLVPRELQGTAQDVVRGIGGLLGGRRR